MGVPFLGSSSNDGQVPGQNPNGQTFLKSNRVYAQKKSVQTSNQSYQHSPIQVDLEDELEHAVDAIMARQVDVIIV